MSDLKLFWTSGGGVTAIAGHPVALEKSLQTLIERSLEIRIRNDADLERALPLIRLSYDAS